MRPNRVHRETPTGPNSPTYHQKVIKGSRRRALQTRVNELEAQLKAANGETRKRMRERLARVTGELAEARKKLGGLPSLEQQLGEFLLTREKGKQELRELTAEGQAEYLDNGGAMTIERRDHYYTRATALCKKLLGE